MGNRLTGESGKKAAHTGCYLGLSQYDYDVIAIMAHDIAKALRYAIR